MTVRQQIRKFGETTSIRGIPRALKHDDKVFVVGWWMAVVICTAMLVSQLTLILMKYYKHEYSTTYREGTTNPVFPDVTVCNVYPLGDVGFGQSHTWSDYASHMDALRANWSLADVRKLRANITSLDYDQLWTELYSPTGYFMSLDMSGNHDNPTYNASRGPLVEVKAFDWNWTPNNKFVWQEHIEVSKDANYYQCYTVRIPKAEEKNVRGMTLIVFIDEFNTQLVKKFDASPRHSISTGIRLAVHGQGTAPDLTNALSAGPGTETTVSVSPTVRQRLEQPYHGCRPSNQPLPDGASETYTADECSDICQQDQIISECGCVSNDMSFTSAQYASVNYTVCGNQTSPVDGSLSTNLDGFFSLYCLYKIELEFDLCDKKCDWPCLEYEYDVTSSQATEWPHVAYHLAFYHTYISGKPYEDRFKAYANIGNAMRQGNISMDEAVNRLNQLDLIGQNFLQVNVVLNQQVPTIVNETISMSSEMLWSNIGGLLSLWLGVTIMTAVEFIELICVIVRHVYNGRRQVALENDTSSGKVPHTVIRTVSIRGT